MRKLMAGVAAAGLSLVGIGALAAGSASAAGTVSAQDAAWMQSNAQTDLTEISAGTLAMATSTNSGVLSLASVTKSQHVTLLAKLQTLASQVGVALPAAPNSMEQAQGTQLKGLTGASFDITYDDDQIAGHQTSIAMTEYEIAHGSDPSIIDFARYYLPYAEGHLQMADTLHATLTSASVAGQPSSVFTGDGGRAGRLSPGDDALIALGALGLMGAVVTGRRLIRP